MASASFVDFVSQAKGITFYGSAIWSAQQVRFELCSIDVAVAVRALEAQTPCPSF